MTNYCRDVLDKPVVHSTIITVTTTAAQTVTYPAGRSTTTRDYPAATWYGARCETCDWTSAERSLSEKAAARYGFMHEKDAEVEALLNEQFPHLSGYEFTIATQAYWLGRGYGRTDI